jgi:hypothetical protein
VPKTAQNARGLQPLRDVSICSEGSGPFRPLNQCPQKTGFSPGASIQAQARCEPQTVAPVSRPALEVVILSPSRPAETSRRTRISRHQLSTKMGAPSKRSLGGIARTSTNKSRIKPRLSIPRPQAQNTIDTTNSPVLPCTYPRPLEPSRTPAARFPCQASACNHFGGI